MMHVHNIKYHCGYSSVLCTRYITLMLGNATNINILLNFLYLAYVGMSVSFSCTYILCKHVAHLKETFSTKSASFFSS